MEKVRPFILLHRLVMKVFYFIFLATVQFVRGQENDVVIDTRVSGGFSPRPERVPYEVRLKIDNIDGSSIYCSGSLVSARTVLTAAHCIDRVSKVEVVVKRRDTVQSYETVDVLPHPQYDKSQFVNDIGLVKLGAAIPLGDLIQPLVLPRGPQLRRNYFANRLLLATGWGITDGNSSRPTEVQSLRLRLVGQARCSKVVSSWSDREQNFSRLCSFFFNTRKGLCPGDSGGPLVLEPNTAVGVTSLLYTSEKDCQCGCRDFTNIFTSVIPYLSWIKKNL